MDYSEDARLKRIEDLLERIAIATELNTWQNSLRNEFVEFPTKQIVPVLTEAMKRDPENRDRSLWFRSPTLEEIRASYPKPK